MDLGIVGLGRMGLGMGARLIRHGHTVVGYDASPQKRTEAESSGITWADSLASLSDTLEVPRLVLIMVPAGPAVDSIIDDPGGRLSAGDIIIDGGNSFYGDSVRRAAELAEQDIHFLDAGVSGGVWGLEHGYCLMVGGDEEAFKKAEPILADLAPEQGYAHVGESGAGHYAKMIHNGIEYGMLQAYGEGFEILRESPFDYDLGALADLWNHGGVIRSWLLELAKLAFEESGDLANVRGYDEDSGECRWAVMESIRQGVPAPVIAL